VVEESSEENDSYGQAELIKKSFEEWVKDTEKEDVDEANQSEVSSKTYTVQERKDVESDYKKVPDDKPVKIESWRERQRKREAEIKQTFNWFLEKAADKETEKEQFIKLEDKVFTVLKSVVDSLRKRDTKYELSNPRIIEVSQGPLYRRSRYKLDLANYRCLYIDIVDKLIPIPKNTNINIFGKELATEIQYYDKFILLCAPEFAISRKKEITERGFIPRFLNGKVYITKIYTTEDFFQQPIDKITKTVIDIIELQEELINSE